MNPTEKNDEIGVRERILNSAIKLFSDKGYHGSSMKEIAGGAGVNKASLFYYFNSKENLHNEIIINIPVQIEISVRNEINKVQGDRERLKAAFLEYIRRFSESHSTARIIIQSQFGLGPDLPISIESILQRAKKPLMEVLESGVENGVFRKIDCDFISMAIFGMLQIFMRSSAREQKILKEEKTPGKFLEFIENGIMSGSKESHE